MSRVSEAKCKKCRREGAKLFLKGDKCASPKCPMLKRNYPPGVHGVKGRKRFTEYGSQLREKQKAKRIYGINERQFRNYYEKAMRQVGDTGEILRQFLELRLDNAVYRSGLTKSRRMARQLVDHGLFTVNGKKVTIPSYQLKAKDEICIKPQKTEKKVFIDLEKNLEKKEAPAWIYIDAKNQKVKVVNKPKADEMDHTFNPRLIVEFYSK